MHMCVGGSVLNVSAYVFLHVHTHVESMSRISVNHSPPYFLRQYLSLILQLTDSASVGDPPVSTSPALRLWVGTSIPASYVDVGFELRFSCLRGRYFTN